MMITGLSFKGDSGHVLPISGMWGGGDLDAAQESVLQPRPIDAWRPLLSLCANSGFFFFKKFGYLILQENSSITSTING